MGAFGWIAFAGVPYVRVAFVVVASAQVAFDWVATEWVASDLASQVVAHTDLGAFEASPEAAALSCIALVELGIHLHDWLLEAVPHCC